MKKISNIEALALEFESKGINTKEKKELANTLWLIGHEISEVLDNMKKFIDGPNPTEYLYNYLSRILCTKQGQQALINAYIEGYNPLFNELEGINSIDHRAFYELIKTNNGLKKFFLLKVLSNIKSYKNTSNGPISTVGGNFRNRLVFENDCIYYIQEMIDSGILKEYIAENSNDTSLPYHLHGCILIGTQEQKNYIISNYKFDKYSFTGLFEMLESFKDNKSEIIAKIILDSNVKNKLLLGVPNGAKNIGVGLRDTFDILNRFGKKYLGEDFLSEYCYELNQLEQDARETNSKFLGTYHPAIFKYEDGKFQII